MSRRIARATVEAAVVAMVLSSCAIADLKRDIRDTQNRVDVKEDVLAAEQRTHAALATQRDQLLVDLRSRELTVSQLTVRLERMRKLNESAPASTPVERQRRDDRARKLSEMSTQAKVLDQDTTLSQQEKARRAEALKEKTRKALEVLLVS